MDHINVLTCTADELQQVKAGKKNSDIDINTIINYRAVGFFYLLYTIIKRSNGHFLMQWFPKWGVRIYCRAGQHVKLFYF